MIFKQILILLVITGQVSLAHSYDFYNRAQIKQDQKDAKRWSLGEWLEQKQKYKLMDSWLMFNAPSPYEFFIGVDTSSLQKTTTIANVDSIDNYRNYRASIAAFVTLIGLYGEYETSNEKLSQWKALFMFRLIGSSDQSTHLTLHYGLMNQNYNEDPNQHQVGGARFNFYLIRAFALTGQYDYILKSTSELGVEASGARIEAGAHIEYGALRIYGAWYQEKMDVISPLQVQSLQKREGILFGTRVYF
jgi:hypothetical protein